ncbi:MAG: thiamine-binding protein [Halanaerobium sp. MSAO_Bac5]|nr:MAG: thiamine-binding protein [Halanaerobium sp. MSAO_Bac5]
MAIAELTVVPLGTKETSLSNYVAGCHQILKEQDKVEYQLTPMGTILEGNLEDIFLITRKMHEVPFENGALRVTTSLKIDDRRDKKGSMKQKLASVESKLN